MQATPKISIIVPTYNCEDIIKDTLSSLELQTYDNFEVVVVDDCSSDNTWKIVNEVAEEFPNIKVYQLNFNSGSGACRNKGIEISSGDYLIFCDADDMYFPDAIEKFVKAALDNDADIVEASAFVYPYCDDLPTRLLDLKKSQLIKFDITEKPEGCNEISGLDFREVSDLWMKHYFNPAIWTKMFKKSLIVSNDIKLYDVRHCEDVFFAYQATLLSKKYVFINDYVYIYNTLRPSMFSSHASVESLALLIKSKIYMSCLIDKTLRKFGFDDKTVKEIKKQISVSGFTTQQTDGTILMRFAQLDFDDVLESKEIADVFDSVFDEYGEFVKQTYLNMLKLTNFEYCPAQDICNIEFGHAMVKMTNGECLLEKP